MPVGTVEPGKIAAVSLCRPQQERHLHHCGELASCPPGVREFATSGRVVAAEWSFDFNLANECLHVPVGRKGPARLRCTKEHTLVDGGGLTELVRAWW